MQAALGELVRQPVGDPHGRADDGEAADQAVAVITFMSDSYMAVTPVRCW